MFGSAHNFVLDIDIGYIDIVYLTWITHLAIIGNSASHKLDKQSLQDAPATVVVYRCVKKTK